MREARELLLIARKKRLRVRETSKNEKLWMNNIKAIIREV